MAISTVLMCASSRVIGEVCLGQPDWIAPLFWQEFDLYAFNLWIQTVADCQSKLATGDKAYQPSSLTFLSQRKQLDKNCQYFLYFEAPSL